MATHYMEEVANLLVEAESDSNLLLLSKGKIPSHIRTGYQFRPEATAEARRRLQRSWFEEGCPPLKQPLVMHYLRRHCELLGRQRCLGLLQLHADVAHLHEMLLHSLALRHPPPPGWQSQRSR